MAVGCCIPAVLKLDMASFTRGYWNWHRKQERRAFHSFKHLAGNLYQYIVMETPQYTGTTVSNWEFSVNSYGIKTPQAGNALTTLEPFGKANSGQGNPIATMAALMEGLRGAAEIKSLSDKVYIYNATPFDDGKSVADFENSPGWLRSINHPGQMITRSLDYYTSQPIFYRLA